MKIKLFYIGIFILALSVGYSSVIPFLSKPVTREPVIVVQNPQLPNIQAKPKENLEIFDVDDFFEEWPENGIEMLETGKGLRLDKVKFRSGDKWLGLFNGHGSVLKNSAIRVTNDDEGWKNISVSNKIKPRFLLKPSKTIREGKVVTLFSGLSSNDDEIGDPGHETKFEDIRGRIFSLGDNNYTFNIKKGFSKTGENVMVLLLEDGEKSQIINVSFYGSDEPYLWDNLIWAGDLDNDNKLDFYMEFYNEKGSYSTGLFLSSKAEKGKLVKMVGGFSTLGC